MYIYSKQRFQTKKTELTTICVFKLTETYKVVFFVVWNIRASLGSQLDYEDVGFRTHIFFSCIVCDLSLISVLVLRCK